MTLCVSPLCFLVVFSGRFPLKGFLVKYANISYQVTLSRRTLPQVTGGVWAFSPKTHSRKGTAGKEKRRFLPLLEGERVSTLRL